MADALEQMNIRVPAGTNRRLTQRAKEEGTSKQDLIRRAIEQYLTRPAPQPDEAMFD